MSIAWKFIDRGGAAIAALKEYTTMGHIIQSHSDDAAEAQARKTSIRTGPVKLTSQSRNPQAGEARLAFVLDEIDALEERYYRALEYMDWFQPAWDGLTEDERLVLSELYFAPDTRKTDGIQNIGEQLHVERAQVYRYRDNAIKHLALLLYG